MEAISYAITDASRTNLRPIGKLVLALGFSIALQFTRGAACFALHNEDGE